MITIPVFELQWDRLTIPFCRSTLHTSVVEEAFTKQTILQFERRYLVGIIEEFEYRFTRTHLEALVPALALEMAGV